MKHLTEGPSLQFILFAKRHIRVLVGTHSRGTALRAAMAWRQKCECLPVFQAITEPYAFNPISRTPFKTNGFYFIFGKLQANLWKSSMPQNHEARGSTGPRWLLTL